MNELFALKYDDLLTEFNRYVVEHPEFLGNIPNEALLVLLDRTDPEFSRYNLNRTAEYHKHDDLPNRPIVYIDVGDLAPVRSRLKNPRVLKSPDFVAV